MEFAGTINGGAPVIKRYQAGTAITVAGIPLMAALAATTDLAMVEPMPASSATQPNAGLALDTAADVAATGLTATSDILVSVAINPGAILRAKMSGGTASDTALTLQATTAASTDGTVTTGVTTLDDSAVWGYDGANAGVLRRADDTSGSVSMNFPSAIASGDQFLVANAYPVAFGAASANKFLDLTATLDQVRVDAAITDTDNFVIVEIEAKDISDSGDVNSFYHLVANNHVFGGNCQAS